MSTRAQHHDAEVLERVQLSPHLVRLVLGGPGLSGFASTGVPDEWVGLVVPGQFQSRYYTVRDWSGGRLLLDVVVHETGLVTEWAARGDEIVGEHVTVTDPKGSFAMPADAAWLLLVGDLTALPAMARIAEHVAATEAVPTRVWAEVPDAEEVRALGYLPEQVEVNWIAPPGPEQSRLAEVVERLEWPAGEGSFWMAGELSACVDMVVCASSAAMMAS